LFNVDVMDSMKDDSEKLRQRLDEEGLLSGFLDGELDAVEIQRVCALTSAAERAEAEVQRCVLRGSIKTFIKAERNRGSNESDLNWSCWDAIESQLVPYPSGYSAKFKERLLARIRAGGITKLATGRADRDFAASASQISFVKGGRRFVDGLFRPQVAGTVFACSLGIMALSLWESRGLWESGGLWENQDSEGRLGDVAMSPGVGAGISGSVVSGSVVSGSGTTLVRENSPSSTARSGDSVQVASAKAEPAPGVPRVAELLASRNFTNGSADSVESWRDSGVNTPHPMSSFVSANVRSNRLQSPFGQERTTGSEGIVSFVGQGGFAGRSAPSGRRLSLFQSMDARGLRVGTADIEWIRSRSHVEIVPAQNEKRPPVIWVGENLQ
jgi:hypothetical protein